MALSGAPDRRRTARAIGAALLAVLLVAAAGCTALGSADEPPGTTADPAGTTTGVPGAAANGSTTANGTTTAGADDGHSHGHDGSHSHGGENATTTAGGANGTAAGDEDATSTPSADEQPTTTAGDVGNVSGELTVVVGDREVTAGATVETEDFRYDADDHHSWTASGGTTLAAALSTLGVEATAGTVRYDGETFRDGMANTAVDVRVNGEPVDPEAYVLRDGDEVWVTVETPGMDRETPGTYIRAADQHVHGDMRFEVDGTVVDFSEPRYQSGHRHFHFEGGHANPWHAHSFGVTLGYAMGTLDGIEVAAGVVTYDGTTYRDDDPGTTVSVSVNGDPVDPATYYLKDGDDVRIVVETDS